MLTELDKSWTQGAFLNFRDDGKCSSYKAKTRVFAVISRVTSATLGVVKWYSKWRKYTYQPIDWIVLDAGCLKEIAEFCELKTNEQKTRWNYSRESGPQFVAKLVPRKHES
jgi:hypothetical protein